MAIPRRVTIPPALSEQELQHIESTVFVDPAPQQCDLLFAFGYSENIDWAEVAALYHRGLAPLVMLTGRHPYEHPEYPIESHAARDILLRENVPPAHILVEDQSTNTYENVRNAKAILRRKRLSPASILYACKTYHSSRCRWLLTKAFREAELHCVHLTTIVDGQAVTKETWRDHQASMDTVYGEYLRVKKYTKKRPEGLL